MAKNGFPVGVAAALVAAAGVTTGFAVARLACRPGKGRADGRAAQRPGAGLPAVLHELSQPLSAAAGLAGLLTSAWPELPDESRLELAQNVENELTRLVQTMRRFQSGGAG